MAKSVPYQSIYLQSQQINESTNHSGVEVIPNPKMQKSAIMGNGSKPPILKNYLKVICGV